MIRFGCTDHIWGEWQTTTAATCTKEGEKERSCTNDGCTEKETKTLDKIDHNYENGKCKACNAVDPAHTHTGGTATCKQKAVCTICNTAYGELAAHTYGAWSITKNPSETSTGTAERVCTIDNSKATQSLPKLTDAGVWTKVTAECIAPTETEDGKDVYESVDFGKVTVVIPKTGGGNNNDNNDNNNNNNNNSGSSNSGGGSSSSSGSSGGSSSSSSSGSSATQSSPAEAASESGSNNPPTGSEAAVFSTAILAAAVMLLTRKRSR